MADPWEEYAEAGPWTEYAPGAAARAAKSNAQKRGERRVASRSKDKGILRNIDAGVRGAADFLSLGFADEAAAGIEALPGLLRGGVPTLKADYEANLLAEQSIDKLDRQQVPGSRLAGQAVGFAGTLGTGALANAGLRGAVAGRPVAQGLLQGGGMGGGIVRGALGGATAGAVQGAGSAEPGADNRFRGAGQGAVVGGLLGAAAQPVAGLLGAGVRAGASRLRQGGTGQKAARFLRGDPIAMRAEAERLRTLGLDPTITDVGGPSVNRRVRAVGAQFQDAGEVLDRRAQSVRADMKPAVMARTRALTGDHRSAGQLADQATEARGLMASTDYAPSYAAMVDLTPEAAQALTSETGMAALRRARTAARDLPDGQQVVSEIDQLLGGDLGPKSGRTLDYVYQNLGDLGRGFAARPGYGKRAAGAFSRQGQVETALEAAPGLQPARAQFADTSGSIDILNDKNVPDVFTSDPRQYQEFVDGLSQGQRLALAKRVEQDILDTLGGQRAATTGSIDTLASSEYSQRNLAAALGDEATAPYLDTIRARVRQAQDASFVSPGAGSRTAVLSADMEKASGAIDTAINVATGNKVGLVRQAAQWLTTRGLDEQLANEVADIATDPRRTDEAIAMLERSIPRLQAVGIVNQLQQLSTRALSENMAARPPTVVRRFTGPGGQPYVELEYPDSPGITLEVPATDSIQ
jgi:hypothetical protein